MKYIYRNISLSQKQFDLFMEEALKLSKYYITYKMINDKTNLFFEKYFPVTNYISDILASPNNLNYFIEDCKKIFKKLKLPLKSVSIYYSIYNTKEKKYEEEIKLY